MLGDANNQRTTINSQQGRGGVQGGIFARRGRGNVEKFVENRTGELAPKEETHMMLEHKSTAHAVDGSTGGRGEWALSGLVSADSVQEIGWLVKGGGLGYAQERPLLLVCRKQAADSLQPASYFFMPIGGEKGMACYTSRTYEERRTIQRLWEDGDKAREIADKLDAPLSSIYSELRRGQDGSRLPNKRLCYNADLAQLRIQQAFERRGRKEL